MDKSYLLLFYLRPDFRILDELELDFVFLHQVFAQPLFRDELESDELLFDVSFFLVLVQPAFKIRPCLLEQTYFLHRSIGLFS